MASKIVQNEQEAQNEEAPAVDAPEPESNVTRTTKKRRIDSHNVTLTDLEVLDCYICCEPLAIPVFQVCYLPPNLSKSSF